MVDVAIVLVEDNADHRELIVAALQESCDAQRILAFDLPIEDWAKEEGIAEEEILKRLNGIAEAHMADKAARFGPELMTYVEKSVVLQVLDRGQPTEDTQDLLVESEAQTLHEADASTDAHGHERLTQTRRDCEAECAQHGTRWVVGDQTADQQAEEHRAAQLQDSPERFDEGQQECGRRLRPRLGDQQTDRPHDVPPATKPSRWATNIFA